MKVKTNVHLYVVEDDAIQAQLVMDKLSQNYKGLKITHFVSGEKFVAYLETLKRVPKKCFLVLDYFLQTEENKDAWNGIDVIKKLQENQPHIKIILYSAYEADDNLKFSSLVDEHENVIGVVKKSDFAYTTLENIIRFDYIKQIFRLKRRRFVLARNIFIGLAALLITYLIISNS